MGILEQVEPRARSGYINRIIAQWKNLDAALRAARLRIGELERQMLGRGICTRCNNQGRFVGKVAGFRDEKSVHSMNVPVFCGCVVGETQLQEELQRLQLSIDSGAEAKAALHAETEILEESAIRDQNQ